MNSRFRMPAEWAPHEACWLAWPWDESLWQENMAPAQREFADLCRAIARSERLEILVPDAHHRVQAEKALAGLPVRFHNIPVGDIWLRDTAPIFVWDQEGGKERLSSARFRFNGWGDKYVLEHDDQVAERVARASGLPEFKHDWILEGGSIEIDGQGVCMTTEQCLLNPNRNPGMNRVRIEAVLRESLGVSEFIWLREGLLNDHTDGHIDTIARFAAPGVALCMKAVDSDDPNREVMQQLEDDLRHARGGTLQVVTIPSPGLVENEDGDVMPASYLNFYISNDSVIVPVYGSKNDAKAVESIARCFPGRKTVGLSAQAILSGGGAFHCITQQVPSVKGNA